MKRVYLDHAATTFMSDEVIQTMMDVMQSEFGNPSSTYQKGRSAKALIEKSRKSIANHFNVASQEILFTSCGTEANNWVINQAVETLGVQRIITTKIEHHAVLYPIQKVEKIGIEVVYLDLDDLGQISLISLENLLSEPKKTLVSLMHVNNEIGTILDLEKVSLLCQKHQAFFHTDAVQSVGKIVINLEKTPVDFLVASAHKFHGPKGIGFLYVKKNIPFSSLFLGGAQEKGWRAGTEATHQIVGMAKALELSYAHLEENQAHIESLKKYAINQLENSFPGIYFTGGKNQFYTLFNFTLPWSENKSSMLLFHLDMKGIEVSRGSACQSGSQKPSHVLAELLKDEYIKKPNLRVSLSYQNSQEDIDCLIETLLSLF
jgi:cysteine desulfurase